MWYLTYPTLDQESICPKPNMRIQARETERRKQVHYQTCSLIANATLDTYCIQEHANASCCRMCETIYA